MPAATSSEMQHSFKWQQVCAWLLRVGLSAAFLSAVADRFGLWGQPGSRGVSWGDMAHFYDYTAEVNAFLPSTLIPAVAWLATIAETGLGFALLSGVCRRPVALATGVLLALFALAMSISLGVHSALAYSVPTAAAAALLLATTDRPRCQGLLRTGNASLSPEGGAAANPSLPISIGDSQMKTIVAMSRTCLLLIVLTALSVGGAILAQRVQHTGKSQVKVTQLSQRDIIEKLDGKAANVTVVEVTFEPGQKDSPHRHTGPVFGYVLEGAYEHALDDEPVKKYKAGDTFYEPSESVHRVARNPSGKTRTRLLAVILHSRDTKETTVPEKGKE